MLSDRELLAAVQAAADDYTVYGELGRQGGNLAALLARERVDRRLVVLMVNGSTSSSGETELSIEVKYELDARIPDGGSKCPACGATLRPWVRFCTRCGHDVAGAGAVSPAEREEMREAVKAAVQDDYEYLGEIRRTEGGGDVFFARERASGRIAALRLNKAQAAGEFELGETNILRKAPAPRASGPPLVSVTQILRKLESDTGTAPVLSSGGYPPMPSARPAQPRTPMPPDSATDPVARPDRSSPPGTGGLPADATTLVIAGTITIAVLALLAILVLR